MWWFIIKFKVFFAQSVELSNVYISNLQGDYKNGDVKLCEDSVENFIDSTINYIYVDNGKETWQRGEGVEVNIDSEDMENSDFFVIYFNYSSNEEDRNGWFLVPVLQDYLKGWVHFIDVHVE